MSDNESPEAEKQTPGPVGLMLRPWFCLAVAGGCFIVALFGLMAVPEDSPMLAIPAVSFIMTFGAAIWGSIIGLKRWSVEGRGARWCTVILLVVLALWLSMLIPAL